MLIVTFILGLVINAAGYIPPGNISLTLAQLTINRGMRQAWSFIFAFSVVEIFFTFGMMRFNRWISSDIEIEAHGNTIRLDTVLDVFMIGLLLTTGILAWVKRNKVHQPKTDSRRGSALYGMLLAMFNPLQIPFWLFCGNYVVLHQWIEVDYLSLTIFSLGSAAGAGLALYGYAHFARVIQEKFALSNSVINKSIAIFLFSLAFYLLVRVMFG